MIGVTIELISYKKKTAKSLALPLDIEVGNAIAEYILHGRPSSESDYIFLRAISPNNKLSDRSIHHIINKYMDKEGINYKRGECKEFHSFRRLRGTSLLEAEVPLTTISQILGQRDPMSAKPYLSLNNEKLRACALEMNGIGIKKGVLCIE